MPNRRIIIPLDNLDPDVLDDLYNALDDNSIPYDEYED